MKINKTALKIYLTKESEVKLREKAGQLFQGRGSVSNYVNKIACESVIFLDGNVSLLLSALNLSPKPNSNGR